MGRVCEPYEIELLVLRNQLPVRRYAEVLAAYSGRDVEQVMRFLTRQEAVEYGFADSVLPGREEAPLG